MKIIRALAGCGIALLLTTGVGFAETYQSVEITADKLNVRETMTMDATILGKLDQGVVVETSDLSEGWYSIDFNGQSAYISADYAEQTQAFKWGNIEGRQVNLRDKPSVYEGVVLNQISNVEVKVHTKQDDWYYITDPDGNKGYVFGDFMTFENSKEQSSLADTTVSRGVDRSDLIAIAKSKLGSPYKWGQAGPNSFDCSGFIQYCYKQAYSIDLGHSSKAMSQKGTTVSKDQLQPGDLVFFTTDRSGNVNHVGIYIGGGEFIHASSSSYNGHQVHINPINTGFYSEVYKWGKRISVD